MKAAVFKAVGEPLAIEDVAVPEPGPSDLILKVTACGICGSDLHMTDVCDHGGGMAPLPPGAVMGHEFAGEVVEAGRDATADWRPGTRACALPYIACGACAQCLAGNGRWCAGSTYMGLGKLAGAYAEYVRVGAFEALRLPDGVDDRAGAMVEPLAVGLHAAGKAALRPGETVLVIGAGPIGLAIALWCRFFGARHVVVSDLVADRVARAAKFGATDGIDAASENAVGRFKRIAGARPDVVFDAVGVPGSQQLAMDAAPAGGRVVVAGVCMQPDRILPVKAVTKELQVNYVFMYLKQDFAFAIDMLDQGRIDPSAMITDTVGFDGFPQAFEALKTPTTQCKVMLVPD